LRQRKSLHCWKLKHAGEGEAGGDEVRGFFDPHRVQLRSIVWLLPGENSLEVSGGAQSEQQGFREGGSTTATLKGGKPSVRPRTDTEVDPYEPQ
jgi:hypothetical protein